MSNQQFNVSFTSDQSPEDVFKAITNVRGWWSEDIQGDTDKLGVFKYKYKDAHRCTIEIRELVPGKKVSWHVVDNHFNFGDEGKEWKDTDIVFEISKNGDKTDVRFTHVGLVPEFECYDICSTAWSTYVSSSLRNLIAKGKGAPNPKQ